MSHRLKSAACQPDFTRALEPVIGCRTAQSQLSGGVGKTVYGAYLAAQENQRDAKHQN